MKLVLISTSFYDTNLHLNGMRTKEIKKKVNKENKKWKRFDN